MVMHWTDQLQEKNNAAVSRAFIIHGNIDDHVGGEIGTSLRKFLIESFIETFDVIVVYSRSSGFYFPVTTKKPRMRQLFQEMCGLATGAVTPPAGRQSGSAGGIGGALSASGSDPDKALTAVAKKPEAALDLIAKALSYKAANTALRVAVLLEYGDALVPNGDLAGMSEADRTIYTILSDIGRDNLVAAPEILRERQHAVIMMVKNVATVSEAVRRNGWEQIEILLPDFEERLGFVEDLVGNAQKGPNRITLAAGVTPHKIAQLTTGLTFRGILDVFKRALYLKQPVSLQLVKDRKDELVAAEYNEVLKIVDEATGFERIGGLATLKAFFQENVIAPMRDGNTAAVPQGVLLMGPPGTGKTRIAKAVAKEAGVTFVELQLSKIYGKYVGDSEKNLERALTAIKSMTPCIVFVDEIDQAGGRGESGDSGVSNRFFKRLLEFMADTTLRGKVLFIAATNRPDLMDAAMKRAGRFDVKVPVMAPDAAERADILRVQVGNIFPAGAVAGIGTIYEVLADDMVDYTGAEIELVVTKALNIWSKKKAGDATKTIANCLSEAHGLIIPTTQDLGRMSRLALENCSDLELVPERYREEVRVLRKGGASPEANMAEPGAVVTTPRLRL
jgi:transitional endoplasmic reticulum ATPase